MSKVSTIVLAAGRSTRYGQPKQLLDWHGKPLVAHVVDVALDSGLDPVVVVLGSAAEAVHAALTGRAVTTVMNWRWEEGLSTSVQAGLAALPPDIDAALFLHCDQPLLTPVFLRSLVERQAETGAAIVHPVHQGERGAPVLFTRPLFPELSTVSGDHGGRSILGQHNGEIATVEVHDPDLLKDLDTPADYDDLHRRSSSRPNGDAVLPAVRSLMIDMDGVLWRGDEPIAGLKRFFAFLAEQSISYVLATNNASKLPEQYTAKLAGFGVEVEQQRILTSAHAAAAYLTDIAPPGTRVYMIGEEGLEGPLEERGFVIAEDGASYVVVGWDRHLSWTKLATAALLINAGAGFVGTNPDTSFPTERGSVPGNGAQLAALEAATGVAPTIIGKPGARMFEQALRRLGSTVEETAVLGDRLDTDIEGGKRAGLATILVLSGISGESDLADSSTCPDLVCADIAELTSKWEKAASQ